MSEVPSVKSAERALVLVEYVGMHRSLTFTQIVDGLSLPRSSTNALLATLVNAGWLVYGADAKTYSLGLRAWQVGQLYEGHQDLVKAAKPLMDALAQTLGETVQLARLDGVENVYISISDSPNPMRLASSVGTRLPAYATGIGKALLSMLDPAEAANRLGTVELKPYTPNTITDVDVMLGEFRSARERGFTVDDEEYIAGCRCVAFPLTDTQSTGLYSALSVTMPISRTTESWPNDIAEPLRRTVAEILGQLGVSRP